ncbi:MAG TPA: LLM class flavin-dependent oxidoreductase [Candidatus Limnocylindria bacterium]|nr:LLM class flavin-dependent oxidoreductase [Candidatus Limnocylindria bacterium]
MKLGATLWPQNTTWDAMREAAVHLDTIGFETIWTWDHFYALAGTEERPNFEATTILAALSPLTKRAMLGALVQGVTYRHPAIIANIAATHDHVSNGRAICGIGAAWNHTEHKAYGIHLGTPGERSRRFAEAARIIRALLDGERVTYDGTYYQLKDAVLNTRPVQQRLPIMVGGGGERKTLRTTAKYADMWHAFGTPDVMKRKIEILRKHCADVGRDPRAVEPWGGQWICVRDDPEDARQVLDDIAAHHHGMNRPNAIVGNADEVAAKLKEHWDVGVRGFIVGFAYPYDLETMERLAKEVRPRLQGLIGMRAADAAS